MLTKLTSSSTAFVNFFYGKCLKGVVNVHFKAFHFIIMLFLYQFPNFIGTKDHINSQFSSLLS